VQFGAFPVSTLIISAVSGIVAVAVAIVVGKDLPRG